MEENIEIDVTKLLKRLLIFLAVVLIVAASLAVYNRVGKNNEKNDEIIVSTEENQIKQTEIDGPTPNGSVFTDQIFRSLTISPTDPNIVYIGTEGNGAFKSTDGGTSWSRLRKGFLIGTACDSTQVSYGKIYDMVINPKAENVLYAAVTCGPERPEKSVGGLYKSIDGGENWAQKISGLPNTGVDSLALDPINPDIIYVGTNGEKPEPGGKELGSGIYKSINGGESFEALPIPEKGKRNRIDSIIIKNNSVFAVGLKFTDQGNSRLPDKANAAGLMKSTDGGQSWQIISPADTFIESFDVSADGQIIIAAESEISGFKSVDGGQNWSKININKPIRINPLDENVLFSGNLYKSNINLGGKTRVLAPGGNTWISDVEIANSDSTIVYAVAPGYLIYKSTDAGAHFAQIANLRDWITNHGDKSAAK